MKTKLLSVSIIAILLLGTFAIFPNAYAVTATMDMLPNPINYDTDTAYVGMTFNVTVHIHDAVDVQGVQIKMDFDDAVINFSRWFEAKGPGYFFGTKFIKPLPPPPDGNYQHKTIPPPARGEILVGLIEDPLSQVPVNGTGDLVILEFVVMQLPPKLGNLTSQLHMSYPSDTYTIDSGGGNRPLTVNDGTYTITWKAPASPHMGFAPGDKVFGPDPPSVLGTTFTEDLVIKGLSAAWYLTMANFDVNYNSTVISIVNSATDVVFAVGWTANAPPIVTEPPGTLTISANHTGAPGGDVVVATVTFTIMKQGLNPPDTTDDVSPLTYTNVFFFDHIGVVDAEISEDATITIHPLRTLELPWLEVVPPTITLGPAPSIGTEFDVGVKITGPPPNYLDASWNLIGVQFRLFYDDTLLEVVSVTEGPFMQNPVWNLYGTFFVSSVEGDGLGPHVLVGELLLPNGIGEWDQDPFPNGQGILATIRFRAIKQECPDAFTCGLIIGDVFGEYGINKDGDYVPFDAPHDGLYTMLPFDMPGRVIDLTGGADNRGYWAGYPLPFPAPFGGQGLNHWMDIVFPQSEITLYALVTYNYWPVQSKDVGFEIEGPFDKLPNGTLIPRPVYYKIWAKFTATTGVDGVATITFRMPWPCENPDMITGVWVITATATVADIMIKDTMPFYYERLVYITSVTTDKFYYVHEEYVKVTVNYKTHAVQFYPALFAVVLTDDLGVPFGMALVTKSVGGAVWCTWKTGTFQVSIFIPKYAYAGYGHVHVSCFDKDPTVGGFAWCPEYAPAPEFQIGPY
jgi:hypothetical protein